MLSARIKSTATVFGLAVAINWRASAKGSRRPGTPPKLFKDGSSMASRMLSGCHLGG